MIFQIGIAYYMIYLRKNMQNDECLIIGDETK